MHQLFGKLVFYVFSIHAPCNVREISGHLAAVALSCNVDGMLYQTRLLVVVLLFDVLAIAAVDQVLRSIIMLIYVHHIAITLEAQ